MALYVHIDGDPYEVIDEGAEQLEDIEIGQRRRAFAGNMRSSVSATKREWKFPLLPNMTTAQLEDLRATVAHGRQVMCGDAVNDLMGIQLLCTVKLSAAPYVYRGVTYERGVTVTISEV